VDGRRSAVARCIRARSRDQEAGILNRGAAAFYRLAPVWGQNLLLTAYSTLIERQRRSGRYVEYDDFLAKSERFTLADLQAYQDERLRTVVAHAYETVPFYRRRFDERGLKPADILTREDLPKLPLLTRDDIRSHFDDLRSRTVSPRALRTGHTSGTTGTPLTVGYDAETIWMTYAVFDRHYRWAGCRLDRDGDRVAVARGNVIVPPDRREPPFWRFNRRQNQMILSSFHLSKANLPAYFDALEEFQPTVLDGYPSTLYVLAKFLQNQGRTFPLKAAVTSSETLYDFQRETIERSFVCRVFDYYALAERVVFSGECDRHAGHHLAMEYGLAETVDGEGRPTSQGSIGKLVGTSLHNLAMPLIRYVTNDMTALRPTACPCGRNLELMDDVTTKAEDVLTLKDGRLISPSVLTHPFKPLVSIEGSQIVQTAPDAVTVRLVPGRDYTSALTAHLIHELQARLGDDVQVKVELVDHLEPGVNGKFKWVISHVPLGL
jgi:phenylacetate-coenzyme A ligase PaaK-like adenylate-forming protein